MKKISVDTYNPNIYPRKLWVAHGIEGLNKVFTFMSVEDPLKESPKGYKGIADVVENENAIMCTCPVMRISDNSLGVLIILIDLELVDTECISHESVHAADYFFSQLDLVSQDFTEGNEAYAYLVGWIAGCVSSSMTKYNKGETV